MTYKQKVLAAFRKVDHRMGCGASAMEVAKQMIEDQTLAPYDTVIDIADIMQELADEGFIEQREKTFR